MFWPSNPPKITQTLAERFEGMRPHGGGVPKEADAAELPRLLRLGGERRGERCRDAYDEGSPVHYSITCVACARTDCGMVSPSARAVFRLIWISFASLCVGQSRVTVTSIRLSVASVWAFNPLLLRRDTTR